MKQRPREDSEALANPWTRYRNRAKVVIAIVCLIGFELFRASPLFDITKEWLLLKTTGKKTVADRVAEFGRVVDKRLLRVFATAGLPMPPARLCFVALKSEKLLEVYAAGPGQPFKRVRTYPILAASGKIGPKLQEGDRQVPEGVYPIELLNPNSLYHLSMRVGYPNAFDRAQAAREGRTNLGGDIMIHGNAVSIGCIAIGDPAAEDLFVLAARTGIENIKVIISPVDFRVPGKTVDQTVAGVPVWTKELYASISQELAALSVGAGGSDSSER